MYLVFDTVCHVYWTRVIYFNSYIVELQSLVLNNSQAFCYYFLNNSLQLCAQDLLSMFGPIGLNGKHYRSLHV